ncbi:DDE superfamily endonuclease [Phytophthora infestans]|uniref:DDE superfamily endonuclease n=1 Tax=Phytophthora infestans TaxID=4787 RepID=A0A833WM08_PHYIN|nr:DDE superfamily endonuclease [Phytophthora infestans]
MDSESSSSEDDDVVVAVLLMREANRPSRCRFNFERCQTDPVWRKKFRFDKDEIMLLVQLFGLPEPFPTTQRYNVAALEALCIFLRRMAYPVRLGDLEDLFGRDTTAISSISNAVPDFIYDKFNYLLEFDHSRLNADTLSAYAEAVHAKGAPLQTCVGFIDGTSVIAPDGIIIHLSGPYAGTRHDAFILHESKLLEVVAESLRADEKHFAFYGDPAYGRQEHIIAPFKGAQLSADEQEFNARMSSVRVSVE